MIYSSKYSAHIKALDALPVGKSYLVECSKIEVEPLAGLPRRRFFKGQGKIFLSNAYRAVPPSLQKEVIFFIRFVRKV